MLSDIYMNSHSDNTKHFLVKAEYNKYDKSAYNQSMSLFVTNRLTLQITKN